MPSEQMIGIPQQVLNAVVDYLMARPYSEVVDIVAALQEHAVAVQVEAGAEETTDE